MDYSTWSVRPECIEGDLASLYERFLLGSLATGASKMSDDYIETLGILNSVLAEIYLTKLAGDCLIFDFKESAADVETAVSNFGCNPWDDHLAPYFIATRSEKEATIKEIELLPEYKQAEQTKMGKEAVPIIKRRFIEIDSVYRHLRNALAHGCFRMVDRGGSGDKNFFFYDVNRCDAVSCCSLIPMSIFNTWYETACDVAQKKL